jgi:predicted SprT family Zn-dependent metalloprotease
MQTKLDSELLKLLENSSTYWWTKAFTIWGAKIGCKPLIKLNKRLTKTGGRAFMLTPKNQENHPQLIEMIDFSQKLFIANENTYYNQIVPHELAHFIAFRVYGEENHGTDWKTVCKTIGCSDSRCHNMVV